MVLTGLCQIITKITDRQSYLIFIMILVTVTRSGELMFAKLTLILPATIILSRPARIQVYKGFLQVR